MLRFISSIRAALLGIYHFLMPDTLERLIEFYGRKLWVRVAAMGVLSVLVVALTPTLELLLPAGLVASVEGASADRLLSIIANAMLAVTTFSLSVMVSVYQSTASGLTPRVHNLIQEDRITQNTLANFIGAYVFALVAIILRELNVFADDGSFPIFVVTVVVMAFIVFSVVRWTLHLQTLGSLSATARQLEDITKEQFHERLRLPCLGGRAWDRELPKAAIIISAKSCGYLKSILPETLNEIANAHKCELFLITRIGDFFYQGMPLIGVNWRGEQGDIEALQTDLLRAIRIGDERSYRQDPRYGLHVLGEIASKALSPGINDAGTAVSIITRIGRIMAHYEDETRAATEPCYPHLHIAPLQPADLLESAFGSISRDGAGNIEVQLQLHQTLGFLIAHPDEGMRLAAQRFAYEAQARAEETLSFEPDLKRLKNAAQATQPH